jgi:flagellar biosynthesis/type III secretory pathway protein FliH
VRAVESKLLAEDMIRETHSELEAILASEGRAEGKAEGLAEGKAEGLAEGKVAAQREVAVAMLAAGMAGAAVEALVHVPLTDLGL